MYSALVQKSIYEPPHETEQERPEGNFLNFLKELPQTGFGRFTLATSLMGMGVSFAGPFFAVHMLNNLKLGYNKYTIVTMTATAAIIVSLGLWGRIIDRLGAIRPIRLCAIIIALVPLPWVVFQDYRMLLGAQVVSGFAWAGFNLAAFVYYLGSVEPRTRVTSIAYFNALNFFCAFVGATLGGWVGPMLPTITGHYLLQTVFLVSFVLRIGPALMYYTIKKEDLPVSKLTPVERMFFDPTLIMRPGITRSILRLPKRSI